MDANGRVLCLRHGDPCSSVMPKDRNSNSFYADSFRVHATLLRLDSQLRNAPVVRNTSRREISRSNGIHWDVGAVETRPTPLPVQLLSRLAPLRETQAVTLKLTRLAHPLLCRTLQNSTIAYTEQRPRQDITVVTDFSLYTSLTAVQ